MLTLFIGHTTAAASTVVAAFLGGLAAGAALGGLVEVPVMRSSSNLAERFGVRATFMVGCLVYALGSYPAGLWSDRYSPRGRLLAGLAVLVVADLLLAAARLLPVPGGHL
mgnify:CR=1 FL=1